MKFETFKKFEKSKNSGESKNFEILGFFKFHQISEAAWNFRSCALSAIGGVWGGGAPSSGIHIMIMMMMMMMIIIIIIVIIIIIIVIIIVIVIVIIIVIAIVIVIVIIVIVVIVIVIVVVMQT